jgi:hypothetical protein
VEVTLCIRKLGLFYILILAIFVSLPVACRHVTIVTEEDTDITLSKRYWKVNNCVIR